MAEDKQFFVGQKAFIEKDGKLLVLSDKNSGDGLLDFPGGKIQEGETDLIESLKREVREETGLEIEVGHPFVVWIRVLGKHHRNYSKPVYLVGFRATYVSGEVTLSNEHSSFEWVDSETYSKYCTDNSGYYQALKSYFSS